MLANAKLVKTMIDVMGSEVELQLEGLRLQKLSVSFDFNDIHSFSV